MIVKDIQKQPLVSIGLPTYNRPTALKTALEKILRQTHTNLQIIVSDNCSNKECGIKEIVEEFIAEDSRIVFYQQSENVGAFKNFQFVLEKATGEYFMWFADDDDKDPSFIETSLEMIKDAGGTFGTYCVKNYALNSTYTYNVPTILKDMPLHKQMLRFIGVFPSVYIYGLFKRDCLDFFLKQKLDFDFFDGYFSMYIVLNYGLNVQPTSIPITILGINEKEYVLKPFKKQANKMFAYTNVLSRCKSLIWNNERLKLYWKIILTIYFYLVMCKWFITYEHKYRISAKFLNTCIRVPMKFVYNFLKK